MNQIGDEADYPVLQKSEGPQCSQTTAMLPSVPQRPSVTKDILLQIPEHELHRIMGEKEEKISMLTKEKETMLKKSQQFKQMLETQRDEAILNRQHLLVEISKKEQAQREACQKISLLEKDLETERELRKQIEIIVAQQMEDTLNIEATLGQVKEDLQHKKKKV